MIAKHFLLFALAATIVNAEEFNLREWLIAKGVDVAQCVTGGNHNDNYGPANLFNGNTSPTTQAEAQKNRWLATQYRGGEEGWAAIEVPQNLLPSACPGLVVKRYRLWHYSPLSDAFCYERVPLTWTFYGSNDGTTWNVIHQQSEDACWRDPANGYMDYFECEIPHTVGYRFFKFQPSTIRLDKFIRDNTPSLQWRFGLMELEIFAEEAPLNLREVVTDAGVALSSCITGTGANSSYGVANLFDGKGMDGKEDLSARWLAGEKSVSDATAVFSIPEKAITENIIGFEPISFRIWRNIATYGFHRSPSTWKIEGSNNNTEWFEIQNTQGSPYLWQESDIYADFFLDAHGQTFRYIRFQPLTNMSDGSWLTWKVGAKEIEWFVKPIAKAAFVVRDNGSETRIALADANASQTFTAEDIYVDGAKLSATGYTLETSSDHGLTWNNATSHEGTSVTLANSGVTAYRVTWNRTTSAYLLNAHADEGTEIVTVSPASQDGYYAPGTQITVTAQADNFVGWTVIPQGAIANGNALSFAMPAAPAEANAQFTRTWRYISQGGIENYPAYVAFAGITDGNWLFTAASREIPDVYSERYFNIGHYVKGSGKLDFSNIYQDLATEGKAIYPLRGILASALCAPEEHDAAWFDGRDKVSEVVISQDILTVEGNAFADCPNLVRATIGGTLEKWNLPDNADKGAFQNCPILATAELPDAVKLPHNIFQGCSALENVVLPATVDSLYDDSLDGVAEVRFAGLPPSYVEEGWANYNGTLAVGCPWAKLERWKQDSRFVKLSSIDNVEALPNYSAIAAKYGNALVGQWDGQWCFRWGVAPGTTVILQ